VRRTLWWVTVPVAIAMAQPGRARQRLLDDEIDEVITTMIWSTRQARLRGRVPTEVADW
jgi:hypothetical protein